MVKSAGIIVTYNRCGTQKISESPTVMAKIKIYLEPDENLEDTKHLISKALSLENSLDHKELYADDLGNQLLDEANEDIKALMKKMYDEIGEVLAQDIYGAK